MNIIGVSRKPQDSNHFYALVELPPGKRTIIHQKSTFNGDTPIEITNYYHGQFPWIYFLIEIARRPPDLGPNQIIYNEYQTIVFLAENQLQVNDEFISGFGDTFRCYNMTAMRQFKMLQHFGLSSMDRICMGILADQPSIYHVCKDVAESFFSKPFGGTHLTFNSIPVKEWQNGKPLHIDPDSLNFNFFRTSKNYNLNQDLQSTTPYQW